MVLSDQQHFLYLVSLVTLGLCKNRLTCFTLVCLSDLEAVRFDSTFLSEPSTLIFTCFPIVFHSNVIWTIFIRVPRQAVANVTHWVQNGPHCGTSSSYSRLTLSETTMASKLASTSPGWDSTQTCSFCPALPEFSPSSTVLSRGNTIYQGTSNISTTKCSPLCVLRSASVKCQWGWGF